MSEDEFGTVQEGAAVREGVRLGIRDALSRDIDRTSLRTVRRLGVAALLGVASACAAVALFARGSVDQIDPMHLAICAAVWSGVLVVVYAFVLLRIGSDRFPVAQASALALSGLAIAAVMGIACPHPMMLEWWVGTPIGALAQNQLGLEASTLCLGLCLAVIAGGIASFLAISIGWVVPGALLSASLLFVIIWPAFAVQSLGSTEPTLISWTVGLALGSTIGVAIPLAVRRVLPRLRTPA